ncbi:MAG: autotransporter-associated beta strand repeat-containing protein [Chthoniobacteraceae bacterium]
MHPKSLARFLALTFGLSFTAALPSFAATYSWDAGLTPASPSGGTGAWDLSTADWSNGTTDQVWTDTTGTDTATFGGTAGTVSVGTNLGALGLTFTTTGYTLNLGGNTLTLGTGGITASALSSGTTTISNGTVALGGNQTWNVGTGATLSVSSAISGTSTLAKSGSGTLVLGGANTYSGATTISAGTLQLTNASALQSTAVTNSSTLDLRSDTATTFATGGVTLNSSTINVDKAASGTGQTLTLGGTVTVNAGVTVNFTSTSSDTLALGTVSAVSSGNTSYTFNASGANVSITTLNGTGAGDATYTFAGNGNFTFGNLQNGGTNRELSPIVNTSGIVTINGSTSSNINVDSASGNNASVTMNNGTLFLDFSNLATPTNLITRSGTHATTFFTLGGGTLSIYGKTGATATSQNLFGGTTFNAGASTILLTNNGSSTTTLTMNALTRNVGGTVNLTTAAGTTFATNGIYTTTTTTNVGGILGGYATVNGTTWAVAPASSGSAITGLADASYSNTGTTALSAAATTANIDVAAAGTNAATASQVVNSLRFNDSTGAATVDATNGLTLTTGGILVTSNVGSNLSTISGGTINGAASADLVVTQNNSSAGLTISSTIADNTAATALTKSGAGLLTLSNATNTYTGKTYLNAGTLNIAADASLGTAPASVTATQLTINGGTLQFGGAFNLATNRGITIGLKGATIDTNGFNTTYAGVIAGTASTNGTLTKVGTGTLTLSAANTYSAGSALNGGTVAISNAAALGSSGNIAFGGGTLQYSGITTDFSSRIKNSTSAISIDTNGQNVTFATALGSTNTGGLTKAGSGTLTITGKGTYSGNNTVTVGTLAVTGTGKLGTGNVTVSAGATLTFGSGSETSVNYVDDLFKHHPQRHHLNLESQLLQFRLRNHRLPHRQRQRRCLRHLHRRPAQRQLRQRHPVHRQRKYHRRPRAHDLGDGNRWCDPAGQHAKKAPSSPVIK